MAQPIATESFTAGDVLIAGGQMVPVTIAADQVLPRGTLLGRVTSSGEYVVSAQTASDGSQVPAGVLAAAIDTTGAAASGRMFTGGVFSSRHLVTGPGWTVSLLEAALSAANWPMFVASHGEPLAATIDPPQTGLPTPTDGVNNVVFQNSGAIFDRNGSEWDAGLFHGNNAADVPIPVTTDEAGKVYLRAKTQITDVVHVDWTEFTVGASGNHELIFPLPWHVENLVIEVAISAAQNGGAVGSLAATHTARSGAVVVITDQSEKQRGADDVQFQSQLVVPPSNDNHHFSLTRAVFNPTISGLATYDISSTGRQNPVYHGVKAVWSAATGGVPLQVIALSKGQSGLGNALTEGGVLRDWTTEDLAIWNAGSWNGKKVPGLIVTGWTTDESSDKLWDRVMAAGFTGYDTLDGSLMTIPGDFPINYRFSAGSFDPDHTYRELWGDTPKILWHSGHHYVAYNNTKGVTDISEASPAVLTIGNSTSMNTSSASIISLHNLDTSNAPEDQDLYVTKLTATTFELYLDEAKTQPVNNIGGGAATTGTVAFRYRNGLEYPDGSKHSHWWQKHWARKKSKALATAPAVISDRLADGRVWPAIINHRIGDADNSFADDQHQGDKDDGEGLVRYFAQLFHMIARASGRESFTLPEIRQQDVYWEPSGAYVEIECAAGDITTYEKHHGETVPNKANYRHRTDVMGFEINERPAERVEIVDGAGASAAAGKIRIYPDPLPRFYPDTKLRFGMGGGSGDLNPFADKRDQTWKLFPSVALDLPGNYYTDGGNRSLELFNIDPPLDDSVFGNQLPWEANTFNVVAADTLLADPTIEQWHNEGTDVTNLLTMEAQFSVATANTTSSVQSVIGLGPNLSCRLGVRGENGAIVLRVQDSGGELINITGTGAGTIGLDTVALLRVEVDLSGTGVIRLWKDGVNTFTWDDTDFSKTHNGQIGGASEAVTVFDGSFDDLDFHHGAVWLEVTGTASAPPKENAVFLLGGSAAAFNSHIGKSGTDVV